MEFGDVFTIIGSKGVVSTVGNSYLSVTIPFTISSSLALSGGLRIDESMIFVASPSDLPTPVAGVISLLDNYTYIITKDIDVSGSRFVLGRNTTLLGGSSEISRLKSTGLTGAALITSQWSVPIRNITIEADTALNLNAAGNSNQAINWDGISFTNCRHIGNIANYNNFSMHNSVVTNSAGLVFDGEMDYISFEACNFKSSNSSSIMLSSSLVLTKSFSMIHSGFVTLTGSYGIKVENEAGTFALNESFILDTVNFSGLGTALSGTDSLSNKASIVNCIGVENSADLAQYYMYNNATATNLTTRYSFYQVSGSTTPGVYIRKFSLQNNRATYDGSRSGYYLVSSVVSFTAQSNQQTSFRVALNGTALSSSETIVNTSNAGRLESVHVQGVVFLTSGSFIELHAANNSSNNATITVSDLNMIITKISV